MPSKIVDFSARSAILNDEPFMVHFWECTPPEFLDFLKNPRSVLSKMGIELPETCRIAPPSKTTIGSGRTRRVWRAVAGRSSATSAAETSRVTSIAS